MFSCSILALDSKFCAITVRLEDHENVLDVAEPARLANEVDILRVLLVWLVFAWFRHRYCREHSSTVRYLVDAGLSCESHVVCCKFWVHVCEVNDSVVIRVKQLTDVFAVALIPIYPCTAWVLDDAVAVWRPVVQRKSEFLTF